MRERPILFSSPMVRAILEGRKTQTRRVVKPQPVQGAWGCMYPSDWSWPRKGGIVRTISNSPNGPSDILDDSPYGKPGDGLWVREAWMHNGGAYCYRADHLGESGRGILWRPSIHMSRRASRTTLEVTGVRVERVQDISEDDAKAEGAVGSLAAWDRVAGDKSTRGKWGPREEFEALWESINGKRAPWESNPWVWVVEFRLVEVTHA